MRLALLTHANIILPVSSAQRRVVLSQKVERALRERAPVVAVALAQAASGGTTVAATALLATEAGIRVFATGGIGGVHRYAAITFDESADLRVLASHRITIVSAGVKSILDIGATLERLKSLGVTVLGFGTDRFPGFYLSDSGITSTRLWRHPRRSPR